MGAGAGTAAGVGTGAGVACGELVGSSDAGRLDPDAPARTGAASSAAGAGVLGGRADVQAASRAMVPPPSTERRSARRENGVGTAVILPARDR